MREGTGGLDEVAGVSGMAGQRVVDQRRAGRAGVRQADGPFPIGGDFGEGGRALGGLHGRHRDVGVQPGGRSMPETRWQCRSFSGTDSGFKRRPALRTHSDPRYARTQRSVRGCPEDSPTPGPQTAGETTKGTP